MGAIKTLQLLREKRLAALLPGYDSDSRLEASGICVLDDQYYVICDNLSQIAQLDPRLSRHQRNRMLGAQTAALGWEDITYSARRDAFYILRETVACADGHFRSEIAEYDRAFALREIRRLPFVFRHANKGFEGVVCVERGGEEYLLALCEANYCNDDGAQKDGGGRIQVFARVVEDWTHAATLALPASVRFADYSALDLRAGRLVVVSQQSRQLWVGGVRDDSWTIGDEGQLYRFPRAADHSELYCNIEGVAWVTHSRIVAVSDRRKKHVDRGPCKDKDESIHLFQLP